MSQWHRGDLEARSGVWYASMSYADITQRPNGAWSVAIHVTGPHPHTRRSIVAREADSQSNIYRRVTHAPITNRVSPRSFTGIPMVYFRVYLIVLNYSILNTDIESNKALIDRSLTVIIFSIVNYLLRKTYYFLFIILPPYQLLRLLQVVKWPLLKPIMRTTQVMK